MELREVVFLVLCHLGSERNMAGRARMDFVLGHLDLGLNDADISMNILFYSLKKNSHERKVRDQETFFERVRY